MSRRIFFLLLGIIFGVGIFFWSLSSLPEDIKVPKAPEDLLWKTISKQKNSWNRTVFDDSSKNFRSYQRGGLLLYGSGVIPVLDFDTKNISFSARGQWIVRSLDPAMIFHIKTPFWSGTMQGVGGWYVDTQENILINFDIDMQDDAKKPLLPSFTLEKGQSHFFDISGLHDRIPELWSLYTNFLPRDMARILGSTSKNEVDSMIKTLLTHEPDSVGDFFHHDLTVRSTLDEISVLVAKIEREESCSGDAHDCYALLDEALTRHEDIFPEVFKPLQTVVRSWLNSDASRAYPQTSWKNVFHLYHENVIKNPLRARVVRDRSILDLIRSGNLNSNYEIWQYLTEMLAQEKAGSLYSLQIMKEMIRIGEALQISPEIDTETKATLAKTAITSLANLRNLLENVYFTKKEYWFVLRTDLIDTEGKAVQKDALIRDLHALIEQIDRSSLLQNSDIGDRDGSSLRVIRAQLAWFNCIFTRNDEYVANPRVCRTTISG